ncbi:Clavaminate synthase-like protein [Coniochaeta ligniaria NRRL 30616]|uniref:Clavaminate synthase-like protein n=1 Tax=Coniochaeta ligniaria NRRL 30616 TaxID=1408157 RepID=A0A1J7JQ29_9PEZI|nr:Clavaminate synthase-like protein [Coniochaeta ligniaria NRRL 30616]
MPHSTSPVSSSLSSLPPFPTTLPHAPIARISSAALLSASPAASAAVLAAAQTYGFFYLDLRDSDVGRTLLSESEQLLSLAKRSFDASLEEKNAFHLHKGVSLFGYKAAGTVKQTDLTQRPDSTEFWNVGKDHMLDVVPSRPYPDVITREKPLFADFMRGAHGMGMVVCAALEREMGLGQGELEGLNRFDMPSGDHVRLTRKKAVQDEGAVGLPSHTDFGSVTVLFNWLGGLQIEGRTGGWEWVVPVEGHAVVNLGDAMVTFTNGRLKSAKHRVVPAPGEQGRHDRYSVVYFVRPHNDALMKPLPKFDDGTQVKVAGKFQKQVDEGKVYSAGEWMVRRAAQLGN